MPQKLFGRAWELRVNDGNELRTWDKIDLGFHIAKTNDTTPNELDLSVFNLGPDSRRFIYRRNLAIELDAGYRESKGLIFKGNTELINHERQRAGWLSKVHAQDGGAAIRNLTISEAFEEETDVKKVIERLLKNIQKVPPGVEAQLAELNKIAQGKVDLLSFRPKTQVKKRKKSKKQKELPSVEQQQRDYLKKKDASRAQSEERRLKKAEIMRGATVQKLRVFCNALGLVCNITDQAINIYPSGLAASEEIIHLDRYSGLISSPEMLEEGGFKFHSLLRHEFNPGHLVSVASKYVNAVFLIQRLEHTGETRGNDWYSDLFCTEYTG